MQYFLARTFRALTLCSFSLGTIMAQQNRITGAVDSLHRVALKGNVHPNANLRFDSGPVDPVMELDHVMIILKRTAAQQADLDRLLVEQQDRSSRNYHAWLTPEQFGDRFGVSSDDVSRVVSWLRGEGFAVREISRARNWIWFSGTAGQVQAALRTQIRRYTIDGELHFANDVEPSVPAAIEPLVSGFEGLDDFLPKTRQSRRVPVSQMSARSLTRPQFTGSASSHFLAPDDFATIYDLNPLYSAGYDGSGQRIVVIGQSAVDVNDIRVFRLLYGLPDNDPQVMLVPGSDDPGSTSDELEADLDIEWAGAIARNAKIIYVYSSDVRVSVYYAINQDLGSIVSYSFGSCEQKVSGAALDVTRALAQQANAQGMTWVAASGDSGAAGCDSVTKNKASLGLGVSFPASLPEVTAVGGTQFDEADGVYWSRSNSSSFASALSYIPERAWNESDASGLASSGGGLSRTFTRPLWQAGSGVPTVNLRAIPDLSMAAGFHDGYLVSGGGDLFVLSGTSAATPAFAGILAVINQYQELNGVETRSGQGNINPNLYRVAQNRADAFHDVTNGDNIVPCAAATPNCSNATLGYTAGPGYDLTTGLGSVDAFNLAVNLTAQWTTPAISLLSPGSVVAGGGNFTLAVNGTGFDSGSVVQWKGTALPTTFLNGTELLATVSGSLIALAGSAAITVQESGGISSPVSLTITPNAIASYSAQVVSNTPPSTSTCAAPPATASFVPRDTVYLYFVARTNLSSNFLSDDWLAPNGTIIPGGDWPSQTGNFCFADAFLPLPIISFNPVGTWQARVYDHDSLLFSVPFTVAATGTQTTTIAHAADGNKFKTMVLLTNASSQAAPYSLRFNDDQGNVPSIRFELESGSLTGLIPAGGSVTIRTAGIGRETVVGWAELTAPPSVGGSVIYSQKTGLPSIQEGTATIAAAGSKHFFMPFDNTAKAITGVALTNASATAANNISVTFRYSDGTPPETLSYPQLASRNHRSFVLYTQFPHTANKSGVAEFTSDANLSVAVFRFNSTGAFTALDATAASISAVSVPRTLAHAADGLNFKTTVLLTNAGSTLAPYTLRFNDDHGNIPTIRFELEAGSAPLTGAIPAGGSVTIRTAGLGDQTVNGWAELTAPDSVGGSVIYSQKTALPSIQEGTATIVASGSTHFFMPFDNTAGAITGVAFTNSGTLGANINVTIRYSDGTSEMADFPQLASRNHSAFVLATQFPNTDGRSGVIEFTATSALSVVEFRFNSTGGFTSFGTIAAP